MDEDLLRELVIVVGVMLMLSVFALTSGCAGQAKYTLSPVILTDSQGAQTAACCEVTINNTKNIGKLRTKAAYNPDTKEFSVTLDEEGVDASGPAAAAAQSQTELIKQLIPLVK